VTPLVKAAESGAPFGSPPDLFGDEDGRLPRLSRAAARRRIHAA